MATLQSLGTVRLRLRLGGEDYQETLHAVQGDTGRVLEFDVLDGSGTIVTDLMGVTPILYIRRPDGQAVGSTEGTISDGVLRIEIPSSLLAYAGEAEAQVQLIDSTNQHKLHDHPYRLQIEESLEAGASPGENLWFSLAELTEAIEEVHLLVEQYDTDVAAVSTMRAEVETNRDYVAGVYTQMSNVITSENARVTAENERKTAETARASAETARASAESTRVSQENTRKSSEVDRGQAEATRVSQESARVTAETARASAESDRAGAEIERADAESTRLTNEETRVTTQTQRDATWEAWQDLIEDGILPPATPTVAGAVKIDKAGQDTAVSVDTMNTELAKKVDIVAGMGLSQNSFTTILRQKLDGIEIGANKYVHPNTHSLDEITETSTKKIMTSAERTKLSGIAANANNYTHPSNHDASMINESTTRRFVSDTEKTTWNAKIGSHGSITIERIAVIQTGGSTTGIPNNTLILELE